MILALLLIALVAPSPSESLSDPAARRAFDDAQAAFAAKDYERASELLERAYILEPDPELLYPWAQAERNLGHCDSAIELYKQFIDANPGERMANAARQNIARCEQQVAATAPPPPPERRSRRTRAPAAGAPRRDEPSTSVKPVGHDVAAGVLVGLGGAAALTGAGLLGGAAKIARATASANDNAAYLDTRTRAMKLRGAGIGMLVLGGGLVVAGAVRYGVVARQKKRGDLALWWHDRAAGLVFTGRF